MNGGLGDDIFLGSEGDDLINGGDGNDTALMGAGDDTFVWNPGDDNDTLEGQDGFDTMLFNGANIAENIDISANGGRVLFTRDIANVVDGPQRRRGHRLQRAGRRRHDRRQRPVRHRRHRGQPQPRGALGGAGDGAAGHASSSTAPTATTWSWSSATRPACRCSGLAAQVNITGAEAANDRIVINGLAGDDVIEASGLAAGAIQLTADGGDGDDVLVGGDGNDTLLGGDGRRRADRRPRHRRPRRRRRRQRRHPTAFADLRYPRRRPTAITSRSSAAAAQASRAAPNSICQHPWQHLPTCQVSGAQP